MPSTSALAEAGGSIPTWLVLTNLKAAAWRSQHDLAGAVGIEGPTLTRHLDGLEQRGLVHRRQDPANRRAVLVELTDEGHAAHARLLEVVIGVRSPAAAAGSRRTRSRSSGRCSTGSPRTWPAGRQPNPARQAASLSGYSGTNQMVASGGSVTSAENGCPCSGDASAVTPRPLPTSEPA